MELKWKNMGRFFNLMLCWSQGKFLYHLRERPPFHHRTRFGCLPHRFFRRVRLVWRSGIEHHPQGRLALSDDQLQPRDRIYRLRYVRPSLLRRVDLRACDGYHRDGAASWRHRIYRWSDSKQPGYAPGCTERANPGYCCQGHR